MSTNNRRRWTAEDKPARWSWYYNQERPHSALSYPCPIDYYRGDPEARLAERRRRLAAIGQNRTITPNAGISAADKPPKGHFLR